MIQPIFFAFLNVFATHFTLDDSGKKGKLSNKFGFDRIIFVCDIKNLKSIFHHFYGADTDFFGYIDKFYRRSIFSFDSIVKHEVSKRIAEEFKQLKFKQLESSKPSIIDETFNRTLINLLLRLLPSVILNNELGFRQLSKFIDHELVLRDNQRVNFNEGRSIADTHIVCCYLFKTLISLYGTAEKVIHVFNSIPMNYTSRLGNLDKWFLATAIYPQFLYHKHNNLNEASTDFFLIDEPTYKVKVHLLESWENKVKQVSIDKIIDLEPDTALPKDEGLVLSKIDIFKQFAKSFQLLSDLGYPD